MFQCSSEQILLFQTGSDDRCYGDLGCFSILGPFISDDRSISLFPESPEEINTRFKLYTRQDQTNTSSEFLVANDPESITNSNFRASRQTKIIVHGFTESLFAPWTLVSIYFLQLSIYTPRLFASQEY